MTLTERFTGNVLIFTNLRRGFESRCPHFRGREKKGEVHYPCHDDRSRLPLKKSVWIGQHNRLDVKREVHSADSGNDALG